MNITPSITPTADVLNLRPDPDTALLVPVGLPSKIATGNLSPLYAFSHTDGTSTLFLTTGTFLLTLRIGDENATPQSLSLLPSAAKCAVATGNTLLIMTDDGPFRLDYSPVKDTWTEFGLMPQFPVIRLHAIATSTPSVTIPATTLSGEYTRWEGDLNDNDCATLRSNLLDAYNSLNSIAMQAGNFIQPVMARYQLLDRQGSVLYESAPVMISAGNGFQLTDSITASVTKNADTYSAVEPITLSAKAFRVGFYAPELSDNPWCGIVNSVKILITPQLHPIDFDATLCYRLETDSDATPIVRMFIPGTAIDMAPDTDRRLNLTKAATLNINSLAKTVQSFFSPFVVGFRSTAYVNGLVTILRTDRTATTDECSNLRRWFNLQLTASESYSHNLLAATSSPHSFSASSAAVAGDTIVYGNISPLRYQGYPATMMAATTTPGAWYAHIKVSFSNGNESVVWHGQGSSAAPLLFSPVLSYPSPDACQMTITVNYADSYTRSRTIELQPLGDISLYISDNFIPVELTDSLDDYIIPAISTAASSHPGAIISALTATPLHPTAATLVSQGAINTITPAVKSSSAWDFARVHLYAFSSTGIHAVSINAARNSIAANIIDNRAVLSPQAVSISENGIWAIAAGDLVKISGSKATTIANDAGIDKVAWCASRGELWCIDSATGIPHIRADSFSGFYRRDFAVDELLSTPDGKLFLRSGETLLNASTEVYPDSIDVGWECRLKVKPSRPRHISWHIFSSQASIALSLRGDHGAGIKSTLPLLRLDVNGPINAPVNARIYAPSRLFLTLSAKGSVAPDTSFSEILIKSSPK